MENEKKQNQIISTSGALLVAVSGFVMFNDLHDLMIWGGFGILFLSLLNLYILYRSNDSENGLYKYLYLVTPTALLFGYLGILGTVSNFGVKMLLGIITALLYYFYLRNTLDQVPEFLGQTTSLTAVIYVLTMVWSFNFFFPGHWWAVICSSMVILYLIFWEGFYRMKAGKNSMLFALVSSLLMVQIVWAVLYWPVHFLVAAVTVFSGYYLIYILASLYFDNRLNKKRVYFHISIVLVLLAFTLLSSPWKPLQ